jgi:ubiquinone/menaquinone biosynthesis C-methylase UbiE
VPLFRRRRAEFGQTPTSRPSPAASRRPPVAPGREDDDWRGYASVAEAYARIAEPRTAAPAADLVEMARIGPGARVLDVGTGTGVVARAAAAGAGSAGLVVGVDQAPEMLAVAARADGGPGYAAARAIDLPFRDAAFDAVLAGFVLTHFARYETALFDMLRVLRPGGRFATSAWGPGDDEFSRTWMEVADEFGGHEILRDAYQRAMPWSERFQDPTALKEALHDAGIRDITAERREYRFEISAEEYLQSREIATVGRFLRQMLGEEMWAQFQRRSRERFAERFAARFVDFRDVVLAAGHKP